MNRRTYINSWSQTNNRLDLSTKEKNYIDSAISKLHTVYWSENLFANSKRIPEDSLWPHINKRQAELSDIYRKDTSEISYANYRKRRIPYVSTFEFSPIFYLRDKSIFVVYILRLCGGECGEHEIVFYRLEYGKYIKWIIAGGATF